VGNIPTLLLTYGSEDEITERVKQQCLDLAPGGGYVLGASPGIMEGIPPENFLAMVQAVHRYGRYGRFARLGQADGTTLAQPLVLSPARPLAY
jgi:uroporphyrinogen-III decarboxylase